jgi:S1-C subfamily serine protease
MEAALAERYANLVTMSMAQAAQANARKNRAAAVTPQARAATPAPTPAPPARPSTIVADLDWIILPPAQAEQRQMTTSMLLVNVVRSGSSADKLGLRAGDIIISVNGQNLAQNEWAEKFLLRKASDLSLVVMRGRERVTLKMQ